MAIDYKSLETKVGKFTFKIPEGHPEAGKKIEKSFDYPVTASAEQAEEILADKKWSLQEMIDDALKSNARSNAYQAALLPYKPSEVSQDDIRERMIRDYIRMGKTEERARQLVDAALAED